MTGGGLKHALAMHFVNFTGVVRVVDVGATDWASVTFAGQRRHVRVTLEGSGAIGAAADFLAAMGEAELSPPGCLVADIALLAEERRDDGAYAALDLELLTISE